MAKTFTFNVNLDRPKFDTGDGVIEFLNVTDLTPENVALVMELQERIPEMRPKAAESDPKAIQDLTQAMVQLVDIVLPDLPDQVRKRLSVGQLAQIIQFWTSEQSAPEGNA